MALHTGDGVASIIFTIHDAVSAQDPRNDVLWCHDTS